MSRLWLTSDTHYRHRNIIEYCARPFRDTREMDAVLASNWNACVDEGDTVLHLGDVTIERKPEPSGYMQRFLGLLNGRKVLVAGNHDKRKMKDMYERELGWLVLQSVSVGDILLVHVPPAEMPPDTRLVVHGHSHGKLKRDGYVDVGVDAVEGYMPVLAERVVGRMGELLLARVLGSMMVTR